MKKTTYILFGFFTLTTLIISPAHAASFDCAKATTEVEKMICADAELSKLDEELDAAYKTAMQDETNAKTIRKTQRYWLTEKRNLCHGADCVKEAYWERIRELRTEYVLVMSKDDNLCRHMLNLYNEDLKKYGEIKYEEHEEFRAIKWEEGSYVLNNTERGAKLTEGGMFSRLDINNDGKDELVFKRNTALSQIYYHDLLVFEDASLDFTKKLEFTVAEARKFRGIVSPPWEYSIDIKLIPHKNLKKYYGGWLSIGISDIEPFTLNDTYYVSIAEIYSASYLVAGNVQKKPLIERPIWHVVVKYTDEEILLSENMVASKLEPVCYFEIIEQTQTSNK